MPPSSMSTTEQFLSSCCKAPYGIGGERSTHWYLCTACGQPTHQIGDEERSDAEQQALMMLNVDNPVEPLLNTLCADCGCAIGRDSGPPDGWQLEDGRTVCQACCVKDTKQVVERVIAAHLS